jgi:putative photosynthetic complex assembly protein
MNQRGIRERLAPIVLFSSISIALVLVSWARATGYKDNLETNSGIIASCDLRFEDMPAGGVHVYDLDDGKLLGSFERGTGSFVRGVMRSMTRERHSLQLGADAPFRLTRHTDGALTIRDQATGREIFLNAFGPSNAEIFARLLSASQTTS